MARRWKTCLRCFSGHNLLILYAFTCCLAKCNRIYKWMEHLVGEGGETERDYAAFFVFSVHLRIQPRRIINIMDESVLITIQTKSFVVKIGHMRAPSIGSHSRTINKCTTVRI